MDLEKLLVKVVGEDIAEKMRATPQSPKWHKEGDVFQHTLLVMQAAQSMGPERPALMLAAIMHDLGKIDTTKVQDDGKITAHGHEKVSEFYFDILLSRIYLAGYSTEDVDRAKAMAKEHMRTHMYISGEMSNPKKRAAFEAHPYFKDIIAFGMCDDAGSIRG